MLDADEDETVEVEIGTGCERKELIRLCPRWDKHALMPDGRWWAAYAPTGRIPFFRGGGD